jgi:hypothetical protein
MTARTPHPETFESSYQMREAKPGECVNSTGLYIRDVGHGQVIGPAVDDARVERAKRCMQACLDDQEIDYTVTTAEARAVLASAPAPAPAVDWQNEPPVTKGETKISPETEQKRTSPRMNEEEIRT